MAFFSLVQMEKELLIRRSGGVKIGTVGTVKNDILSASGMRE